MMTYVTCSLCCHSEVAFELASFKSCLQSAASCSMQCANLHVMHWLVCNNTHINVHHALRSNLLHAKQAGLACTHATQAHERQLRSIVDPDHGPHAETSGKQHDEWHSSSTSCVICNPARLWCSRLSHYLCRLQCCTGTSADLFWEAHLSSHCLRFCFCETVFPPPASQHLRWQRTCAAGEL